MRCKQVLYLTTSAAHRNCPASLAGVFFLLSCVVRRSELLKDFRPGVLGNPKGILALAPRECHPPKHPWDTPTSSTGRHPSLAALAALPARRAARLREVMRGLNMPRRMG